MVRSSTVVITALLFTACAPPRWAESSCRGLPDTWELDENSLKVELGGMSDAKLLDLVACNMGTSHPPNIGLPESFITSRGSAMTAQLITRLERKDEGVLSMSYVQLLRAMAKDNPQAVSLEQRRVARDQCMRHFSSAVSCASF